LIFETWAELVTWAYYRPFALSRNALPLVSRNLRNITDAPSGERKRFLIER
jgi:hypothetical protein